MDKLLFGWPTGEDGKPMVLVSAGVSEKIGLPQYSNVDIGPITVTRFVPDGTDEEILEHVRATATISEQFIAEERKTVLAMVQSK